jgi:hypothetical protein
MSQRGDSNMTYTGGIKPGSNPATNKVDNNVKPAAGTPAIDQGWGSLPPYPNLAELPPVPVVPVATPGWKTATVSDKGQRSAVTIGDSEARHARGQAIEQAKTAALSAAAPINNQQSPESSDDSTSGSGVTLKDIEESNQKAIANEAQDAERVAERQREDLKKLHEHLQDLQQSPMV